MDSRTNTNDEEFVSAINELFNEKIPFNPKNAFTLKKSLTKNLLLQ